MTKHDAEIQTKKETICLMTYTQHLTLQPYFHDFRGQSFFREVNCLLRLSVFTTVYHKKSRSAYISNRDMTVEEEKPENSRLLVNQMRIPSLLGMTVQTCLGTCTWLFSMRVITFQDMKIWTSQLVLHTIHYNEKRGKPQMRERRFYILKPELLEACRRLWSQCISGP